MKFPSNKICIFFRILSWQTFYFILLMENYCLWYVKVRWKCLCQFKDVLMGGNKFKGSWERLEKVSCWLFCVCMTFWRVLNCKKARRFFNRTVSVPFTPNGTFNRLYQKLFQALHSIMLFFIFHLTLSLSKSLKKIQN